MDENAISGDPDRKSEERQYFRFFRNHDIPKSFLEQRKNEWFEKNRDKSNYPDLIWSLSNELIHEYSKSDDFFNMKMLYFELAFFQKSMNKEFFHLLQQSKKMELFEIRKQVCDNSGCEVTIRGGEPDCPECNALDGKIFTIREALEKMPIPPKKCSHNNGWCTCCYTANFNEK